MAEAKDAPLLFSSDHHGTSCAHRTAHRPAWSDRPLDWTRDLKNIGNSEFSDRRKTAAEAKAALLRSYRAAQEAAEPTREAKQAERLAIAEAREARRAAREQSKLEEQKRSEAEAAEREAALAAAARAEAEARAAADTNRTARVLKDEATRKAERDLRYANRKARRA